MYREVYKSQNILAPLQLQKLTPSQVHKTIQGIDIDLSNHDAAIPIHTIAEQLHINVDELSMHINTLESLYYIRFADRAHQTILLTLSGRFTIVPNN